MVCGQSGQNILGELLVKLWAEFKNFARVEEVEEFASSVPSYGFRSSCIIKPWGLVLQAGLLPTLPTQALLLAINVRATLALMLATSRMHPDSTEHLRWLIEDLNLYAANKSEKHMSVYEDAATASLAKRAGALVALRLEGFKQHSRRIC